MGAAGSGREIYTQEISAGANGVYRMAWGDNARLIQYSPPDDACFVWAKDMSALDICCSHIVHGWGSSKNDDWASADLELFVTFDANQEWCTAQIELQTTLFGDTGRADAIDALMFAQANWTDGQEVAALEQFEDAKEKLAQVCIIPRTVGSIKALKFTELHESDLEKACSLIGLDADTTSAVVSRWQACREKGQLGLITSEQISVAIRCEFEAKVERSEGQNSWTISDSQMVRKDLGRTAVRTYQHELADPKESFLDRAAFQSMVAKLVEHARQLNSDDLWQVAERRLRSLHKDFGLKYE